MIRRLEKYEHPEIKSTTSKHIEEQKNDAKS